MDDCLCTVLFIQSGRETASGVKVAHVQSINLRGCGAIANMSLRTDAHYEMAMDAAEWLIKNQVFLMLLLS